MQVYRQSFVRFMKNSWADGQFSFSAQKIQLLNEESIREHFEAQEETFEAVKMLIKIFRNDFHHTRCV